MSNFFVWDGVSIQVYHIIHRYHVICRVVTPDNILKFSLDSNNLKELLKKPFNRITGRVESFFPVILILLNKNK